jgi:hypothetical protein
MIADEIQTGIGRTGRLFAYEHFALRPDETPDIMTLGKGLGGGVPLAALCAKESVAVFEHGEQGGTYNGSPLMTAVGCAVLSAMLEPGFLGGVAERGQYLGQRLQGLVSDLGLSHERVLCALDLGADLAGDVMTYARDGLAKHAGWEGQGILLNAPRPDLLRFMPALNLSYEEIDRMIDGEDRRCRQGHDESAERTECTGGSSRSGRPGRAGGSASTLDSRPWQASAAALDGRRSRRQAARPAGSSRRGESARWTVPPRTASSGRSRIVARSSTPRLSDSVHSP